ncbi:PREDICTED: calcium uniporter regulatory subunit MCUb, mitochondrial [Nanorana parkeri]|uniref:calcium uniporter regulatory subunit MCUb, mitochondrial n=1 Tax=Nanorana parkeri TaxID=125878 RepID=UPI000853FE76|nr:PREDICTED: calcium uniporter regulatory subunit MCUb, mitochondrial [Nanorana parkeri]
MPLAAINFLISPISDSPYSVVTVSDRAQTPCGCAPGCPAASIHCHCVLSPYTLLRLHNSSFTAIREPGVLQPTGSRCAGPGPARKSMEPGIVNSGGGPQVFDTLQAFGVAIEPPERLYGTANGPCSHLSIVLLVVSCMKLEKVRNVRQALHVNTVGFYSTLAPSSDVAVQYKHGLPVITVSLPSRNERCQFTIKPFTTTVGKFLKDIQNEDQGIEKLAAISTDGAKFSSSTLMDVLLKNDFHLVINNSTYHVQSLQADKQPIHESDGFDPVKSLIQDLYSTLHLEELHIHKEHELLQRIEAMKEELLPLEQIKLHIMAKSEARTKILLWTGLAILSTQGGALGYLTWWVYSWDIMEPVTYFLTYGNAIAFGAYYILTNMDYVYPDARDREFLHFFYKRAKKQHFDVDRYNQLRNQLAETEESLRRLQNPLKLKLPIEQLQEKE